MRNDSQYPGTRGPSVECAMPILRQPDPATNKLGGVGPHTLAASLLAQPGQSLVAALLAPIRRRSTRQPICLHLQRLKGRRL